MALTDLKIQSVKAAARSQKLSDGEGMYLFVSSTGSKVWRIDYSFGGKRVTYTLGKYPVLGLAAARAKRLDIKRSLLEGINPALEKKALKIRKRLDVSGSFATVAAEWYVHKSANRSVAWREANSLYLSRDLNPQLGPLSIRDIDVTLLLSVLEQSGHSRGVRVAERVRQTANQIFEYAILRSKAEHNPASKLRRWAELPPTVSHAHLVESEIHSLVQAIESYRGRITTRLAARLLLLTFVRKTELAEAQWDEFDLPTAKWIIPAERMKMAEAHVVPLSMQAIDALNQLRAQPSSSIYLFPKNSTVLKPMNRTSLNNMFAKMGRGEFSGKFTPHGVRSTASTWLNEKGFRTDAIERQLAHSERNSIRASYNHADYMSERRNMMQAWADFIYPFDRPTSDGHV